MTMLTARLHGSRRLSAAWAILTAVAGVFLAAVLTGCGDDKKPTRTSQAPVVQLLTPHGGENYFGGATVELTWLATDGDTPAADLRISIDFSADDGSIWMPVAISDPNDGVFEWLVPSIATTQARIRVTASDGVNTGSAVSAGSFIISVTPPPPRNALSLEDVSGAPGAVVDVPLSLQNLDAAGLVEARIGFDGVVAQYAGARLTGRGAGMQLIALALAADTVKVTLQQQGGAVLAPGDGPIALISFQLTGATGAQTELHLAQARLLDPSGGSRSLLTHDGSLTVLVVDTPATLTAAGWVAFEAGNFTLAGVKFDAAIGLDAQYGPAFAGRGWVRLTGAVTPADFAAAGSAFDDAVGRGEAGADVHGGRAAARLALGGDNLAGAVAEAQAALAAAPSFVFPHRTSFDYRDLHLIAAFAEAGRGGRYAEARQEADQVQPSGIRQADPQSWMVDGVRFPTFESAVLGWLHKMSAAFAG